MNRVISSYSRVRVSRDAFRCTSLQSDAPTQDNGKDILCYQSTFLSSSEQSH